MLDLAFYKDKKILVTGHTGFKGAWMCAVLLEAGADVTGYALAPPTDPALFDLLQLGGRMRSVRGDIRELESLSRCVAESEPEIVIHMAAQPIVRDSYKDPVYTYETNVMGTVHILEAVRNTESVRSFVNVTTDKVYKNNEWAWGYRETDELNGHDPYSNSKSCSELVTDSYKRSFFTGRQAAVTTVRAGNVIGGGDFATDRIVPDCARAAMAGEEVIVRNPHAVRPYQHVLEPVTAYLEIAQKQYADTGCSGSYNIGPEDADCITTGRLASLFCEKWNGVQWRDVAEENAVHEAGFLKLDCSLAKSVFGITPCWGIEQAMEKTVEWYQCYAAGEDAAETTVAQIHEYLDNEWKEYI